ncbi:MAG: transcription termination factor Rho [Actinomycetaceae bacterium]
MATGGSTGAATAAPARDAAPSDASASAASDAPFDDGSSAGSSSTGGASNDRTSNDGSSNDGSSNDGAAAEQASEPAAAPRQRRSRRAVSPTAAPSTAGDLPDLGIALPDRSAEQSAPEGDRRGEAGRDGAGRDRSAGGPGTNNQSGGDDRGVQAQDEDSSDGRQRGGNGRQGAQQGRQDQSGQNRQSGQGNQNGQNNQGGQNGQNGQNNQGGRRRGGDSSAADFTLDDLGEAASRRREGSNQNRGQDNRYDDEGPGGRRRRNRDRNRDRRRRGRGNQDPDVNVEEIEVSDDDVLLPVAGIVDILDQYAFVRTSGYLPGSSDVYVTLNQVRKFGLRRGDAVTGAVRQGDDNQQSVQNHGGGGGRGRQNNQRQKFNPLVRLDTVNGMTVERARQRPEFGKLTPLYPQDQLRLETTPKAITPRVIDLVSPVGKGQRGLIVSPPKAGKTIIMQQIANAIAVNNPDVHLMVVLVDERPEEVTDMQRLVKGEVIASTFDRPASDHTVVAELAIERAKRLVELGQDVVVLLDSLTRLSRAYNLAAPASGRILSGGVDASALYPPKKFFGAARNIENGGSLTILASALVETGSKMDEVIFEEFKGTGNMELRLSRQLADKRIFPAVDVNASGTRREELLMSSEELKIMWKLRRVMGALDLQQASDLLLGKLRETHSNAEFLMTVQKNTPTTPNNPDPDYAIQ